MTTITNNKLTDETLSAWKAEAKISLGETAKDTPEYSHHAAIFELVTELQERRRADNAEPVKSSRNPVLAYADSYRDMAQQGVESVPVWCVITDLERNIAPLYAAPPAPVAMKDHQIRELVNDLRDIAVKYHGTQQLRERIARTIRAAMLQGSQPVSNRDELHDGWVACSERLPPEGYEPDGGAVCYLVWHKNEVDCGPQYSISSVFFLRKHWEKNFTHWMPLPAAPQQEVK